MAPKYASIAYIGIDMRYRMRRWKEKATMFFIWKLPKSLIYWAMIRGMADVNKNHPDDMKPTDYLKAWGK